MTHHVLVLDSNAAVQAIIRAALKDVNVRVKTPAGDAHEEIRRLRPLAVLAAGDLEEQDALDLCRTLKKEPELKSGFFILLAPGSQKSALAPLAEHAGVDALLFKPFKSDQVREVILPLLQQSQSKAAASTPAVKLSPPPSSTGQATSAALLINDPYLSALLESTLERLDVPAARFSSLSELKHSGSRPQAVFVDSDNDARILAQDPARFGTLVRIGVTSAAPAEGVIDLASSFSINDLLDKLGAVLPFSPEASNGGNEPLDQGQQTLLAAKISSVVYEKLLTQDALRHRKWEEACSMIGAEALRICRSYRDG